MLKWRRGEVKGFALTVMKNISLGMFVRKRELFSLEVEDCEESTAVEEEMMDPGELLAMMAQGLETDSEGSILPHVSMHEMNGIHDFRTMRVTVSVKGKAVQVLIDTGSTHNFLDRDTAKKLGCVMTSITPFNVSVADGNKVLSHHVCKKVEWKMQGVQFTSDMLILPIGGCSMVLGIQWLITLGDIMWNFRQLKIEFSFKRQRVSLRGAQPHAAKLIQSGQMDKLLAKPAELCMISVGMLMEVGQEDDASLCSMEGEPAGDSQKQELAQMLDKYADLFETPKDLPPSRGHDHKITLKEGSSPVNIRPYRYPNVQKDEIEKMVKEMLQSGVIRSSTSPYSSPIVMVKKKDETWRLCVDYRELNNLTVKDKFPIPVIEELLDELQGARYFSKLDLRSGYYQISMFGPEIPKTAFRTHHGHYEFLVMPFGLTNAPSTFQSLMNQIFLPHLRKFILVFFDDILIYSPSWPTHLSHLEEAFRILREAVLFVKRSKCDFGVTKID